MNKFIEDELKKCKIAHIDKISETEYVVTKQKETEDLIKLNSYYIIELEDYIIHPNENFTLAENWNKGVVPKSKLLKVMITQILGKMMKVDAVGVGEDFNDLNDVYMGLWLPFGGVKILKEL